MADDNQPRRLRSIEFSFQDHPQLGVLVGRHRIEIDFGIDRDDENVPDGDAKPIFLGTFSWRVEERVGHDAALAAGIVAAV